MSSFGKNLFTDALPVSTPAAAGSTQQRAEDDEEEGEKDTNGESTENVDQHV